MSKAHNLFQLFAILFSLLLPSISCANNPELVGGAPKNSIESLTVNKTGGNLLLKIGLRQSLAAPPAHFSIAKPARLVFDLPDTGSGLGYTSKTVNEGGLHSLNVIQSGDRSRLVLNLDKITRFDSRLEDRALIISLTSGEHGGSGSEVALQQFAGSNRPEIQSIRDIQFRRSKDGAGTVVVDLSVPDAGIDIHQKGSVLFVSFKKTSLPEGLQRQLDVVDFSTPITAVRTRAVGDNVNMEIVPKGLWEHTAFQTDNQFIVEVRPVRDDPAKLFQGSKIGYRGETISLNFQNIPLRELLHVFADITNFNIVVSDSVSGNVSLRLNDVPWDHALEIVLQQKNLAMRKSGNVLWIAPRDELAARDKMEVEAREAAVTAEAPRLEVFQLNYQKAEDFVTILTTDSNKSSDASSSSAKTGLSGSGFLSSIGKVSIDKRTNQAFIYDVPSKLELIRGLLAKIDRPARQVLIEARIVEADSSFGKSLGVRMGIADPQGLAVGHKTLGSDSVRWGVAGSQEYINYHVNDSAPLPLMTYTESGQLKYDTAKTGNDSLPGSTTMSGNVSGSSNLVNLPATGAAGQFALAIFNAAKTQMLSLELSARESDGLSKVVSSPRVLTADQVEASIEQGFRIPYPTASSSGAISIAYINATLSLKVKPQITPDGRVMMNIKINKDAPGTEGRWGYTVKTKEIKSDVLIENGGTVVIGGVFETDESESNTRVPFFGDLPYVGFLFKSKTKSETKNELIIMITPKVVDDSMTVKL